MSQFVSLNPERSDFLEKGERHTMFSMGYVTLQATNAPEGAWGDGRTASIEVPRAADLAGVPTLHLRTSGLALDITGLPDMADAGANELWGNETTAADVAVMSRASNIHWVSGAGYHFIKNFTFRSGSAEIFTFSGQWMYLEQQLMGRAGASVNDMVCGYTNTEALRAWSAQTQDWFIPIPVPAKYTASWAYPLIGLQLHKSSYQIVVRGRSQLINHRVAATGSLLPLANITGGELELFEIVQQMYFLDKPERQYLAHHKLVYLYPTVQSLTDVSIGAADKSRQVPVIFGRCALAHVITCQRDAVLTAAEGNRAFDFGSPLAAALDYQESGAAVLSQDPISAIAFHLNNNARYSERPGKFYRTVTCLDTGINVPAGYIYVLPFTDNLKDFFHPRGGLMGPRVDSQQHTIKFTDSGNGGVKDASTLNIYCLAYNVYVVDNGVISQQYA